MDEPLVPEHMDTWSRNRRVYETLKGMGLYVVAVPELADPSKINHLIVSAGAAKDVVTEAPIRGDNVISLRP